MPASGPRNMPSKTEHPGTQELQREDRKRVGVRQLWRRRGGGVGFPNSWNGRLGIKCIL